MSCDDVAPAKVVYVTLTPLSDDALYEAQVLVNKLGHCDTKDEMLGLVLAYRDALLAQT